MSLHTDMQERDERWELASRAAGEGIWDWDMRSHLVETLAAILGGQSLRSVADELFIHTKTLLFRKHRIEEILGESLEDPAVRLNLALALQLHRLN